MKAYREMPLSLFERDAEAELPHTGSLIVAAGVSLLFWAALVLLVI